MYKANKFYINGEWVSPSTNEECEVINPATEEVIGSVAMGSEVDVNKAVAAAKAAFETFSKTSIEERMALLDRIIAAYKAKMEKIAACVSQEMGAPISMSNAAQAPAGLGHLLFAKTAVEKFEFSQAVGTSHVVREPIGVCGLVTPWNWPVNQITAKVGPAIAAGCTMVLKPSEIAPFNAIVFTEIMHDAGTPPGVFNLINGNGEVVGNHISGHPDIDMVSFTGSTRAGKLIQKNAADTIKKVTLELGGKGGNIVFEDSYPDAVRDGVRTIMSNTGQSCDAPTRMLVQRSIYDRAVKEAVDEANKIKVDVASKKGDHIGPLVSKVQYDKVINLINEGIKEGATLAAGGPDLPNGLNKGYFVKPTIFTDVNNDMKIAREEIFGPVLSIIPFDTEEEAIKITNDTSYGLGNYLQTEDKEKAKRVARKVRAGTVYINGQGADTGAPFGGFKQSGNGREGGLWGFTEYLEVKAITGWN